MSYLRTATKNMTLSLLNPYRLSADAMGSVPQNEIRRNWRKMGKHLSLALASRIVLGDIFLAERRNPHILDPPR